MKITPASEPKSLAALRRPPGPPVPDGRYQAVPLSAIRGASPLQTRAPFDPDGDEADRALLASLAADGQRLPVLLAADPDRLPPSYTPLDGHRRLAALRRLNHDTVLAVVHTAGSLECDLITLTANVRKHLTPLEQARAITRLRERHTLTLEEIARRVGLSARYVADLRALLEIDPALQAALEQGRLHAKAALALGQAPPELQPRLAEIASAQPLTEAEARRWVNRLASGRETPEQAARAVGLAAEPPDAAPTSPASPSPRARRETALTSATAEALLQSTFVHPDPAMLKKLAAAAPAHKATAAQLKLAALLALAGQPVEDALDAASYVGRHPSVRRLLPVVDALAEVQALGQERRPPPECARLCLALSRQFGALRQALTHPRPGSKRSAEEK